MDKYDALTRYSLANRKLNNGKVVRIDRPPVRRTSNGRPDGQLDRSWVRNVSPFGLDQVEFHQATNRTFDPYMPIVVVGAQLGGIVLAILWIHSLSGELAIAGSVCYVAVLAIALSTNVRINKQIARWSVQSPPEARKSVV